MSQGLNLNVWWIKFFFLCFFLHGSYASINGHSSKLSFTFPSKDNTGQPGCSQPAKCIPVQNFTCFGISLPYASTSLELVEDSETQFEIQDNLELWQGLRSVPRCWAVVQPLLCAVYMPKCDNGTVFLPSQEMCRITRGPCKTVEATIGVWPPFLQCENKKLFPPHCRNPLQEIKFNTSYKCMSPLVETDNPDNWFHEIEGCGIQCQNPFFSTSEHDTIHNFIFVLSSMSLTFTALAVATFAISWKSANRYPGVIVFHINMCLAVANIGWLIQFFYAGARDEIVCLQDGTIRQRQPRSGEHLCNITFWLVYYSTLAGAVWFVILAYTWHVFVRESGSSTQDLFKKHVAYFHLSAWCIPLVLTVCVMAMKGVDGDSMSGICFVGYANSNMRLCFLFIPIVVAGLTSAFFLSSAIYGLRKVKMNTKEQAKKEVNNMLIKICIFAATAFVLVCITVGCHAYDFHHQHEWMESLTDYIVCRAKHSSKPHGEEMQKCSLQNKPSLFLLQLHVASFFSFGFAAFFLICNRASIETWKCFFFRLCAPAEQNNSMKKHHIIAKAYPHRQDLNRRNFSFSLNSNEDPVGMNFDVNSIASRELSSSWAMALPRFITRRNGLSLEASFVPNHCSSASDISRHISQDSFNQPNLDSLSIQEQEYVAHTMRHQRRKTRRERERLLRTNPMGPYFRANRRGSDTSIQSNLMAASIVAAAKNLGAKVTKSTSTGDLGMQISVPNTAFMPPMILPQMSSRHTMPREPINPPFTHGMTDNSHRLNCRNPPPIHGTCSTTQSCTPNPIIPGFPNPLNGIVRPPIYAPGYNMMGGAYMGFHPFNGMHPGYPSAGDFGCSPYGQYFYPIGSYPNSDILNQCQPNLLPMLPRAESASENEYFPIVMSDSEYTDGGHRSYNEAAQLLVAQRLVQDRIQTQQALAASAQCEPAHPKPSLEPQACAKTQFLARMGSFNSKTASVPHKSPRPPSGRKSPHSEAPPPSPADSLNSLETGDDDVFEGSTDKSKEQSVVSLPSASETQLDATKKHS